MTFVFRGRYGKDTSDPNRCRASVHDSTGWGFYQCQRRPTVFRCLEGAEYGFCKQHDPEAAAERRRKRDAEWSAKWAARDAQEARRVQERKALDGCKRAIEQIAAGHNDPRSLAIETLALFPAPEATEQDDAA